MGEYQELAIGGHADSSAVRSNILLIDSDRASAQELRSKLAIQFPGVTVSAVTCADDTKDADDLPSDIDLVVARLSSAGCGELGHALRVLQHSAASQVVFWSEDAQCPQVSAARAVGVRPIMSAEHLWPWLCEAMPSLIMKARSQRLLHAADRALPPIPTWNETPDRCGARLPLPQAENLFRETYLRRLLTETTNYRRAAELAGIPYRTFYDMIKKLGL